jgi:hypothetical protein
VPPDHLGLGVDLLGPAVVVRSGSAVRLATLVSRSLLPGGDRCGRFPSMRALLQVAGEQVRAVVMTELTYLPR